ncbi:phospholipase A2 isoform X2 [Vespula squamosa]|uniref:Phospholipase A2 n=1 Tax=Vespula squamosa TaxID=30214 RepID=A0ABD2C1Q9_VESSQ
MLYARFLLLMILILTIEQSRGINVGSIFGFGRDLGNDENNNENDNDNNTVSTKISPVEQFLKTLLIPVEALGNAKQAVGKGVNQIISKLPGKLKNPIKDDFNSTKLKYGQVLNLVSDKFRAIYPGTLWCGDGDIAKNEDDLGFFASTDACCRAHDMCSNNINSGEEKYRLLNNGIFTRLSHCSCDSAFYNCLKNADSIVATKIGFTYFDVLSPQCFNEDYPIIKCNKYSGTLQKKCVEYSQDSNEEKKYQWFDNPTF